jgi:O-antigen ligase
LTGLVIQIPAIILTGAISSILTLIVFAFIYLLFFQKRIAKFLLIPLTVIFLLILFFWSKNYFYIKNSTTLSYESRERIFQNVIRGAVKKPVLGYGWANVDYAFNAGNWPIKFVNDVYVDKAHSEILEVLVTTGVPGLTIYLSVLYIFVKTLIVKYQKSKDKIWNFTLLSIVILYLFHSQTNVISICEEIIFWLVLGIAL